MKNKKDFRFLFIICLTLVVAKPGFSQITVDAGKDTTYCTGLCPDTMYLGTNISIINGVEPYSYRWECKVELSPTLIFTASDYLNDTTIATPYFKDWLTDTEKIKFVVYVTDNEGNSAMDSINIGFSGCGCITGTIVVEINKGDSVWLDAGNELHGKYKKCFWEPKYGLTHPDSSATWCKPEVKTSYSLVQVDTFGCTCSCPIYEIRIISKKVIEPNKKWMYAIGQEYPTPVINRYDCLTIGEDTVISNKEYYKLYNLYNCEYENSNLRGFIRETEDAKVYFLPVNEKQEWLLYDFGLNVGDSIYTDWNDSYLYMDSIVTDETNKKIYYVRFQNQSIQWIEEVGSNIGLLMERITGGLQIFTCCFRDEELIYRLPEYSSCDITLSNEVNKMPVPFNLYPNPASEKINIEINKSPTNALTGKIIAIDGTTIKSFKIDNKPNYILDVHSLYPGLYFIQIHSGAETYTQKVIIK